MGVFTRPDSPFYWLWLEGLKRRERTHILVERTAPLTRRAAARRAAKAHYAARMLELATQRTEQILDRVGMTESPIPIAPVGETEPIPESPWMNAERAARYLSKGRDFVRREVQAGRLRAARIGKRGDILTRAEWLDDYVTERASPITVGRLRRV